jgi:dTDP-4-dehydrorhamnose reductase
MEKKRILITGGTGLLATNWAYATRDKWNVILATHQHEVHIEGVSSYKLELGNTSLLREQLDRLSPDLVIHTAGMTSVDRCEKERELALYVNADIARNVASATAERNISLVHISTDHLFSGKDKLYKEDSPIQPLNEYARTKALAEKWVLAENSQSLIIRTNFFCWGHVDRQSFSDWLYTKLSKGEKLSLFDDVFFTPILADELALAVHELVEKRSFGVYNLVGDERISKYDFGIALCKEFDLPTDLIKREQLKNVNLQAERPQDMSLDNYKAQKVLGRKLGTVAQFLSVLHKQELDGRKLELLKAIS